MKTAREMFEESGLMNKLKNYFEEYLKYGMCQYEAPFIGRNDVITMLKVFKALDKACELIAEAVNQDCTIFDEIIESPYIYRTEVREWKEWLLNDLTDQ